MIFEAEDMDMIWSHIIIMFMAPVFSPEQTFFTHKQQALPTVQVRVRVPLVIDNFSENW